MNMKITLAKNIQSLRILLMIGRYSHHNTKEVYYISLSLIMEGQSGQREHFLILINDLLILINDLLILIHDLLILINIY